MAPKPLVTTQQPQEYDELDRLIDRYLGKMPRWMARFVTWIRQPHLRLLRMVSGVLLVFFGFLGFLPILGFWMVPLGLMLRLSGGAILMGASFFAALLYFYPESGLKSAAEERTRRFTRDLPGALDVMRLVAQSGGDLLSAIRAVIDVMQPGPVREELARVVAEVTIGTSLATALNNVAARIGTNEANAVFSTLAQSLEMGTSVAENLQGAAQLIRHAARVKAQTQAQKAVVNMSFPLLLLILPGIFIVLFAPLVIQFINR